MAVWSEKEKEVLAVLGQGQNNNSTTSTSGAGVSVSVSSTWPLSPSSLRTLADKSETLRSFGFLKVHPHLIPISFHQPHLNSPQPTPLIPPHPTQPNPSLSTHPTIDYPPVQPNPLTSLSALSSYAPSSSCRRPLAPHTNI